MRYLVLLRHGLWQLNLALMVERAHDGEISCTEPGEQEQGAGMRWLSDGTYWLACGSRELKAQRTPLTRISEPEVAFSIPGSRLVNGKLPAYGSDMRGYTVQISAHAVLEEPQRVALQLILVPRGEQPYHRETVGDRRIDEGDPDMWIVLDREGEEPAERLVARRVLRWPPPLGAGVRP